MRDSDIQATGSRTVKKTRTGTYAGYALCSGGIVRRVRCATRQECLAKIKALEDWASRDRREIGARLRYNILKRDGFRCRLCGASADMGAVLEVDHRHPFAHGGGNTTDNLWSLCVDCNRGKAVDHLPATLPEEVADLPPLEAEPVVNPLFGREKKGTAAPSILSPQALFQTRTSCSNRPRSVPASTSHRTNCLSWSSTGNWMPRGLGTCRGS